MGEVIIRESAASDAAAYRELRLEGLLAHPEAFGSDHVESAARPESHWLERASFPAGRARDNLWFAEAGGALIGTAGVYSDKAAKIWHTGTVVGVYVRPAWRGRRVAERLLTACIDWATAAGFRRLRLAVATTNGPAIRAYTRAGFTVYGVEPEVICAGGVYYDELLMSRALRVSG